MNQNALNIAVANLLNGKDWHCLSKDERALYEIANELGLVLSDNGFVRKVAEIESITDRIERSEDLITGEYYYLLDLEWKQDHEGEVGVDTQFPEIRKVNIAMCKQSGNEKYFNNSIWASEHNPQAFHRWAIYGPVSIPAHIEGDTDIDDPVESVAS